MIDVKHAYANEPGTVQGSGKRRGTQINDGEEGGKNVIIAISRDNK